MALIVAELQVDECSIAFWKSGECQHQCWFKASDSSRSVISSHWLSKRPASEIQRQEDQLCSTGAINLFPQYFPVFTNSINIITAAAL